MLIQTVANSGCRNWEYGTCGMNSKHPEDIHRHLQRAKVCFFTIQICPNISEYFQIKKIIPNQWETLPYTTTSRMFYARLTTNGSCAPTDTHTCMQSTALPRFCSAATGGKFSLNIRDPGGASDARDITRPRHTEDCTCRPVRDAPAHYVCIKRQEAKGPGTHSCILDLWPPF